MFEKLDALYANDMPFKALQLALSSGGESSLSPADTSAGSASSSDKSWLVTKVGRRYLLRVEKRGVGWLADCSACRWGTVLLANLNQNFVPLL